MKRSTADLILAGISLIWGMTFVMVKNALGAVGPATFIAWRFVVASLALIAIFSGRIREITRAEIAAGALLGLALGSGYLFQTVGLQFTSTGKAGFITGLSVVIVPLLAAILLRKPPGWLTILGVAAATVGLGMLSLNEDLRPQPGDLWVLAGAVGFALHIVGVSHFAPKVDPVRLALVQMIGVAAVGTALAFVIEVPTLRLPFIAWGAILFTGVLATALVFTLQTHVQRFTTSTHTALIFALEPIFAAFFGWLWAGEMLGPKELIGSALILAGIVVSELSSSGESQTAKGAEAAKV